MAFRPRCGRCGVTYATPSDRVVELRLESSICRNCRRVVERFLADGDADGGWHHSKTGEWTCEEEVRAYDE